MQVELITDKETLAALGVMAGCLGKDNVLTKALVLNDGKTTLSVTITKASAASMHIRATLSHKKSAQKSQVKVDVNGRCQASGWVNFVDHNDSYGVDFPNTPDEYLQLVAQPFGYKPPVKKPDLIEEAGTTESAEEDGPIWPAI